MPGTFPNLTRPVILVPVVCVMSVMATVAYLTWSPTVASAVAAPAKNPSATAVKQALKLLKGGKATRAAGLLNKAITSGALSGGDMARALYYRGLALRKMGKPAQAVADFTNALWLKNGLSAALRADAERNRTAAYEDAGILGARAQNAGRAPAAVPAPRRQVARARRQTGPQAGNWQTQTRGRAPVPVVAPAPKPKPSSSGIGGFFKNLFGGGTKKAAQPPTTTASVRQRPVTDNRVTQVSAWSSKTSVALPARAAAPRPRQPRRTVGQGRQQRVARRAPAPSRSAPSRPVLRRSITRPNVPRTNIPRAGRSSVGAVRNVPARRVSFGLILSPVRSLKLASANAVTVKQQFGRALGQRKPIVEQMSFGGTTFYQVRIGPFADAASPQSICTKLKSAGIDCILAKR